MPVLPKTVSQAVDQGSESTLAMGYVEFASAVGWFLGYGRSSNGWTTEKTTEIDEVVQSGLRQFYFPAENYQWTFLRPVVTLVAWSSQSGTVSSLPMGSDTQVTSNSGITFYPTMVGKNLVAGTASYLIIAYVDSVTIHISGSAVFSESTATVTADGDYDLPTNYGGIDGDLTFGATEGYRRIPVAGEGQVRALRMSGVTTGRPQYAAIQPKTSDGADGQRFRIMFWPTPDAVYNLTYRYNVLTDKLSTANPYPLGGMAHSETILQSCLAVAEQRVDDSPGNHAQKFAERMRASIEHDRKASTPEFLGYNRDRSDEDYEDGRHRHQEWVKATVGGLQY